MSGLAIEAVTKRFGDSLVLDRVGLTVEPGEFLALLGASGCGKTTLLRMIAGFETPTSGAIRFGDRLVAGEGTHLPPEARNVAIVFQSYALWPHMSVAQNVGYPLRVRGVTGPARGARIAEALAAVGLEGFGDRRPADLSGGQRQRVALARCLAMEPAVVLLDEPLANLDVHLRASMEDIFKAFHKRTGATMIYVTHDQSEAMAMADRIAVMDRGRLLQVAAPHRLYAEPADETVARFVGHGRVVDCTVLGLEGGRARIRLFDTEAAVRAPPGTGPGPARLCLRAEALSLRQDGEGFAAGVEAARFTGAQAVLTVRPLADPSVTLFVNHAVPLTDGTRIALRVTDGWILPPGPASRGAQTAAA